MSDAKQRFAGLFRRGVPEVDSDQYSLLLAGVVSLLVKKHGQKNAATMLSHLLQSLSKPPQR